MDNVDGSSTSSTAYDYYVYYPTDVKVNGNTSTNSNTSGYLYAFYCYYGKTTNYAWNEFCDNVVTNNTTVNYMYSAYVYYYNSTNSWKVNRNYIVNNRATGSTGYHYFYLYYYQNYEVIGNVVAGNKANSQYIYIYSALSGSYTAEIRNNTFQANTAGVPTPGSSYIYGYFWNPTVVADLKQDDEMIQSEIFAPVITVQKFTDEAEAVRHANGVKYGLASSASLYLNICSIC